MPEYEILLSSTSRKQIDKLPFQVAHRILEHIGKLSANPRPAGCTKLKGVDNSSRIRVGDYRVIYEIEDYKLKVLVIGLGHPKDIYE